MIVVYFAVTSYAEVGKVEHEGKTARVGQKFPAYKHCFDVLGCLQQQDP